MWASFEKVGVIWLIIALLFTAPSFAASWMKTDDTSAGLLVKGGKVISVSYMDVQYAVFVILYKNEYFMCNEKMKAGLGLKYIPRGCFVAK